jgi:hypothetical protein
MNLGKFYWRVLLVPAVALLISHIAYMVWDQNWGPGKDYKSEWLTKGAFNELIIMMVIGNAIVFALLCLPIFLSNKKQVRNNRFLIFFSWFALPLIWISYLLGEANIANGINADNSWILINILPYLLSLTIGFLIFRSRS